MTNATWHLKKRKKESYLLLIFLFQPFLWVFIHTHGQIKLWHVATLMIFETFEIKICKEV